MGSSYPRRIKAHRREGKVYTAPWWASGEASGPAVLPHALRDLDSCVEAQPIGFRPGNPADKCFRRISKLTRPALLLLSAMFACCLTSDAGPAAAQQEPSQGAPRPLTVEAIFGHGPLMGEPPGGLTWSPDGKHLTYMDGGELIDLDLATAKSHVLVSRAKLASLTGAAGTETDRDHRERYKMASYLWAPDSTHLLFDSNGRLWLYDLHNGTGVQVGFTGSASGDDPQVLTQWGVGLVCSRPRPLRSAPAKSPALGRAHRSQRQSRTRSTARSTGSTKKSLKSAATTSGRRTRKRWPICR